MNLYKVMLVDDEEPVRQAIARKLNWEEIGFQVIATAENGKEAVELAEKLHPDVVMTDIKMPFMDGLTLCQHLKAIQRNTKVVIFSGFDEFEYAKEAIKLEVEEYILKPIDSEELKNVFIRIKASLDAEKAARQDYAKLYEYYQKSLPIMKEQFMTGLLAGTIPDILIDEMNRSYEVHLKSAFYAVVVFKADDISEDSQKMKRQGLLNFSLKQMIDEYIGDKMTARTFVYLDTVTAILMLNHQTHFQKMIGELDQICNMAHRLLDINVTAGIGQLVNHLSNLSLSYKGAVDAADYRVLLEANQAIYILDIQPSVDHDFYLDEQDIQKVLKSVKLGTKEEIKEAVEELIHKIKNSNISLRRYQVAMMEMITELSKLGRSYHLNLEEVFGGNTNFYKEIEKFDSLEALEEWLYEICIKFCSYIRQERTDSTKLLTEKAQLYIKEHYEESDLSVDVLCNYLNVSAAYFSTIFKRATGENFVSYLTNVRMEAALELLNNTQDKTYVISAKVGYVEPNYFSYVFKKKFGISPSKYRLGKVEEDEKEN